MVTEENESLCERICEMLHWTYLARANDELFKEKYQSSKWRYGTKMDDEKSWPAGILDLIIWSCRRRLNRRQCPGFLRTQLFQF